jgi:hypothetical protein
MSLLSFLAGTVHRCWFSFCQPAIETLWRRALWVTVTCLAFGMPASYADPGFITPLTFPARPYPLCVAAGDFNRDGHLDLAVLNQGDHVPQDR